jgi:DNA polymerase
MFVGEAPGANEDKGGLPFIGQAGRLLDTLLDEVGLERADVFIANVLKCRPPGNRDPRPIEIETCRDYLERQVELIEPKVICTLGNFSTKLLRDDTTGISKVHGRAEVKVLGRRAVTIFPIYHPAAALYTRSMLDTLRADFAQLPSLLAAPPPPQPDAEVFDPVPAFVEAAEDDAGVAASVADEAAAASRTAPERLFGEPAREEDGLPDAPAAAAREPVEEPDPQQLGLF